MYKLIVFDWDGTLMDSQARIVACLQDAARDVGVSVPNNAQARDVIGLGLQEAIARLFATTNTQQQAALVDAFRQHFLHQNTIESQLFPGVVEVLQNLHEADFLLAVATGKSRRGLDRDLQETGIAKYFVASRCADETHSKPHPQMLLDILDELGMPAPASLVVGDTEYDMQMARNAGAAGLGVTYGMHDLERLLAQGAHDTINAIDELIPWLQQRTMR